MAAALGSAWTRLRGIDFQTFYESAAALRAGSDPYLTRLKYTNLNPPHFIVAFTPFTWFEPHTALAVWQTVNLACLVAATMLIWRELELPQSATAFTIGIVAAGVTTALPLGIEEGHPMGFLTQGAAAAWKALRHDRWKVAGILIGTLASLKPFFGLPPLAGPLAAVAIRRPAAVLPLVGLLWPIPELIALAPITRWTAVSLLSLPFWAVVGTWSAVVCPLTVDGRQDNAGRDVIHAPEAVS